MGCSSCGGGNKTANGGATPKLSYVVDLAGSGETFKDGSSKKTFATQSEANLEIAKSGLAGKATARPSVS